MEQHLAEPSLEELAAIQQSMASQTTTTTTTELPVTTTEPPVTNTTTTTEPPVTSSLTSAETVAPVVQTPAATTTTTTPVVATEPVVTKSFEEYLEERTAGKFKKWDEVEQIINTPKEEFADDTIKHWNELAKKGIKLDKEFFEIQSLDLDEDTMDPEDVILQAMRRKPDYSGLSERTLKRELDKKYNYSAWIEKFDDNGRLVEGAELSEDDLANQEIMMRDAQKDLDWLKNYKKERTFVPEQDPEVVRQQAEMQKVALQNFNKFVDEELFGKVKSFSTQIKIDDNTTEVFDFGLPEAERKEIADLMKLLPTLGTSVLVNRFAEKQPDGSMKINDQKVYQMLLRDKLFDQANQNAYKDGMAYGAKKYVKEEVKNANFQTADHNSGNQVPQTEAEALALAIKNSGKKFT